MVLSFMCDKCAKNFSSNSGLWYHKRKCEQTRQTLRVKIHKCTHCNYETTGPKCTLQNHIYSKHTKEEDRPFQCRTCIRGFSQKSHLIKHMKKIHNTSGPKICDRNIVEYHITILEKVPISEKAKSRINMYRKHPIIKADDFKNLTFYYTKQLKPSHLHYDMKREYIHFDSKTNQ
jgi:uncharacterized Zn-finger protein